MLKPEPEYLLLEDVSDRWDCSLREVLLWGESGHLEIRTNFSRICIERWQKLDNGNLTPRKKETLRPGRIPAPRSCLGVFVKHPSPSTSCSLEELDSEEGVFERVCMEQGENIYSEGKSPVRCHISDLIIMMDEIKRFESENRDSRTTDQEGQTCLPGDDYLVVDGSKIKRKIPFRDILVRAIEILAEESGEKPLGEEVYKFLQDDQNRQRVDLEGYIESITDYFIKIKGQEDVITRKSFRKRFSRIPFK